MSIAVTVLVISILILAGPAQAVTISMNDVSSTTPAPGDLVTFTAEVEVEIDENIPVTQVELDIRNGSMNLSCYYNLDGSLKGAEPTVHSSLCSDFSLARDPINSYAYSDNRYGFGYSVDGPANASFGPGYGYGYGTESLGYGYGYGATPVTLRYFIEWDTTGYDGQYDIRFKATANDESHTTFFSYASDPTTFTIAGATDTTAPDLSTSVVGLSSTSADIFIIANEESAFTIYYGTSSSYDTTVAAGAGFDSTTTIGPLTPATTYYYVAQACDASMNCANTSQVSFTTPAAGDAPVIAAFVSELQDTSAKVSATASETVTFTTYAGTDSGNMNIVVGGGTGLASSMVLGSLSPSTTYFYVVQGCDTDDICVNTSVSSFTTLAVSDTSVPTVTANIISTTGTSATVSASSNEIVDFTIFYGRSQSVLNSQVLALDTTHTETVLAGLQRSTLYYYYVKACDAGGNCAQTDIATFTTAPPVISFSLVGITSSSVTVHSSADQPVDFRIFYGIGNTESSMGAGFDTASSTVTLAGLAAATSYDIRVQGCSEGGVCAYAPLQSFTTLGTSQTGTNETGGQDGGTGPGTTTPPVSSDTPPGITAVVTSIGQTSATIEATSNETVDFAIYYGDMSAPTRVQGGSGTATSFDLTSLAPGTTYSFRVEGCNALCANTSIGLFTTLSTEPLPPLPVFINFDELELLLSTGAFSPSNTSESSDNITVMRNTTIMIGNSSIFLQEGTVIARTDNQPINMSALIAGTVNISALAMPSGFTASGAISWGLADAELSFSIPIQVRLYTGGTGTSDILRSVNGAWTASGLSPGSCTLSGGICSFSASLASTYAAGTTSSTPEASSSSSSSRSSGGSGGSSCASGYERVNGRCVETSSTITAEPIETGEAPEEQLPEESFAAEETAAPENIETSAGDLLTGQVTGDGTTGSTWLWLGALIGLIVAGLAVFLVMRRR